MATPPCGIFDGMMATNPGSYTFNLPKSHRHGFGMDEPCSISFDDFPGFYLVNLLVHLFAFAVDE